MSSPKIYTRDGDDGSTGLFYGGRVAKNSVLPNAYGAVDEAQAFLGLARVASRQHGDSAVGAEVDELIVSVGRDLYVVMAELATAPENRSKLSPGLSLATAEMVDRLENLIDDVKSRFVAPSDFAVPGGDPLSAALDVARTVVRRAERETVPAVGADSHALRYLNRLSDLVWTLARWVEGSAQQLAKTQPSDHGDPT